MRVWIAFCFVFLAIHGKNTLFQHLFNTDRVKGVFASSRDAAVILSRINSFASHVSRTQNEDADESAEMTRTPTFYHEPSVCLTYCNGELGDSPECIGSTEVSFCFFAVLSIFCYVG